MVLTAYSNSNWATNSIDRRSITGYCTFLGSTLISWSTKKQLTIAHSSSGAEYQALAASKAEIIWIQRLLQDFNVSLTDPTVLHCDNISAIALANNPIFHAPTKHIEIDYHFIHDRIKSKEICVHHINSEDHITDILTKIISTPRFSWLRDKLAIQEYTTIKLARGPRHDYSN